MTLTNAGKETIIVFNERDRSAEVFTYNSRMKRELDKLVIDRPSDVQWLRDNGHGGMTYIVPKKWVKIRASRILSEAQRELKAAAMRKKVKQWVSVNLCF